MWGMPALRRLHVNQIPRYPISSSSSITDSNAVPPSELRSPGTFSRTIHFGARFLASSANRKKRPLLAPCMPARCELAWLRSWQGQPAAQRSVSGMSSAESVSMSPCRGTSGQCRFRIAWQYGSISQWNAGCIPAFWNPRSKPPMPAKNDATRILLLLITAEHPDIVDATLRALAAVSTMKVKG